MGSFCVTDISRHKRVRLLLLYLAAHSTLVTAPQSELVLLNTECMQRANLSQNDTQCVILEFA